MTLGWYNVRDPGQERCTLTCSVTKRKSRKSKNLSNKRENNKYYTEFISLGLKDRYKDTQNKNKYKKKKDWELRELRTHRVTKRSTFTLKRVEENFYREN